MDQQSKLALFALCLFALTSSCVEPPDTFNEAVDRFTAYTGASHDHASSDRTARPSTEAATDSSTEVVADPKTRPSTSHTSGGHSIADVVQRTLPGVVGISTTRTLSRQQVPLFRRGPRPKRRGGKGSGVIVDDRGLVLTNHHVVRDADKITVTLWDERSFEAEVVGADEKTDLAILELTSPPKDLRAIEFGDSDALQLGQQVIAIGNPFGLSGTVTTGIVSAKGRGNVGVTEYEDFIQTDAAINPGNSGGALVSLNGELIGINTAILSRTGGSNGIGFAIPSNMARQIMNELLDDGTVQRGYLGVTIQTLEPALAEGLGLQKNAKGVVVASVGPETPAANAGLKRGDVIVAVEEVPVEDANQLRNEVGLSKPGTTVSLALLRDGAKQIVDLKLGTRPRRTHSTAGFPNRKQSEAAPSVFEGVRFAPLNRGVRARFDIPGSIEAGILVAGVAPGSRAARSGLRPGDVIVEADRRPVESPRRLEKIVRDGGGGQVLLLVWRKGRTLFLPVAGR